MNIRNLSNFTILVRLQRFYTSLYAYTLLSYTLYHERNEYHDFNFDFDITHAKHGSGTVTVCSQQGFEHVKQALKATATQPWRMV